MLADLLKNTVPVSTRRAAGLCVAAMLALAGTAQAQTTQTDALGALRSTHDNWQVRCDTPPGAQQEQCAMVQAVTASDRPNVALSVVVLKTADHKSRLLRVIAPLGVLLPAGLGLKVDGKDVGRAPFLRCLNTGCFADVVLEDSQIDTLRNGKEATFIIFQTEEEGIGIPLTLKGFGEGFDELK